LGIAGFELTSGGSTAELFALEVSRLNVADSTFDVRLKLTGALLSLPHT